MSYFTKKVQIFFNNSRVFLKPKYPCSLFFKGKLSDNLVFMNFPFSITFTLCTCFFLRYITRHNDSADCYCKKVLNVSTFFEFLPFPPPHLSPIRPPALAVFCKQYKLPHKFPCQRHLLMSSNVIQEHCNIQGG